MNSQKLEDLLNLSLDADEEERERSPSLQTGYLPGEKRWELIVRYFGDISRLEEENIPVEKLLGGYGIITVPEDPTLPLCRRSSMWRSPTACSFPQPRGGPLPAFLRSSRDRGD